MDRPLPTETRLLGLTPCAYQQLKAQARVEATRLRSEAIGAALEWIAGQAARLIVRQRARRAAPAANAA